MSGRFKSRGGSTRGGRGFKRAGGGTFGKKRASPDDNEGDDAAPASRAAKKSKAKADDEDEEVEAEILVPTLKEDGDGNSYVALKTNDMRRVTINDFKGSTLVQFREYWRNDGGDVLPGKKGIALTMDQFNAFVQALPLLEGVLKERGEQVVRPDYDGLAASAEQGVEGKSVQGGGDDEDEEEEE